MKKSIFSACMMTLFSLTLFAFTSEPPAPATEDKPKVKVTLKPGFLSLGNIIGCVGPGFCPSFEGEIGGTTAVRNNLDGTVTISYNFEELNEGNQEYYTSHSDHEVPEDSDVFSNDELAALELPAGTLIKAGAYPVELTASRMIVTYDLVQ